MRASKVEDIPKIKEFLLLPNVAPKHKIEMSNFDWFMNELIK